MQGTGSPQVPSSTSPPASAFTVVVPPSSGGAPSSACTRAVDSRAAPYLRGAQLLLDHTCAANFAPYQALSLCQPRTVLRSGAGFCQYFSVCGPVASVAGHVAIAYAPNVPSHGEEPAPMRRLLCVLDAVPASQQLTELEKGFITGVAAYAFQEALPPDPARHFAKIQKPEPVSVRVIASYHEDSLATLNFVKTAAVLRFFALQADSTLFGWEWVRATYAWECLGSRQLSPAVDASFGLVFDPDRMALLWCEHGKLWSRAIEVADPPRIKGQPSLLCVQPPVAVASLAPGAGEDVACLLGPLACRRGLWLLAARPGNGSGPARTLMFWAFGAQVAATLASGDPTLTAHCFDFQFDHALFGAVHNATQQLVVLDVNGCVATFTASPSSGIAAKQLCTIHPLPESFASATTAVAVTRHALVLLQAPRGLVAVCDLRAGTRLCDVSLPGGSSAALGLWGYGQWCPAGTGGVWGPAMVVEVRPPPPSLHAKLLAEQEEDGRDYATRLLSELNLQQAPDLRRLRPAAAEWDALLARLQNPALAVALAHSTEHRRALEELVAEFLERKRGTNPTRFGLDAVYRLNTPLNNKVEANLEKYLELSRKLADPTPELTPVAAVTVENLLTQAWPAVYHECLTSPRRLLSFFAEVLGMDKLLQEVQRLAQSAVAADDLSALVPPQLLHKEPQFPQSSTLQGVRSDIHSIPLYEIMCQLLFAEQPTVLPLFALAVERAAARTASPAAGDADAFSIGAAGSFICRAIVAVPLDAVDGEENEQLRERRRAVARLHEAASDPFAALDVLARGGLWNDAASLLGRADSALAPQLFRYALGLCLALGGSERLPLLWQAAPAGLAPFDVLDTVQRHVHAKEGGSSGIVAGPGELRVGLFQRVLAHLATSGQQAALA
eukprot:TRINITY_DN182_c0_g2_i2.p1 TRINITY_DN182_c0_g2~~TRINITY_DN182_c0_g2_i2.p1  ORF type:complete len:908 (+),score=209.76 TRINITY_DN182_c0_g2_i2:31-2724(+)